MERANIWSTKEKEKYLMKENECCDGVGKVGKYLCLQGKKYSKVDWKEGNVKRDRIYLEGG